MKRKKVLVSACLLNEACRYDGSSKKDISTQLEGYDIIPYCPEKFMGIPRPKISLHVKENSLQVIREDGKNITQILEQEIDAFIDKAPLFDKIILKAKSPSCGFKTTPIHHKEKIEYKNGILVEKLLERYSDALFFDENSFEKGLSTQKK